MPRWENEPCSSGYACDSGLECEAGTHVCTAVCRGPTAELAETHRDFKFSMIVMSDPQWGYCNSDHCRSVVGSSQRANELHAQSLQALADSAANFRGVIVNGDLTHLAEHDELSAFRQLYEQQFVIYPGLGNHDYHNYLDKACSPSPGAHSVSGGCTNRMLDYMSKRAECNENIKEMDYVERRVAQYSLRTGSYSYYFDIGNYRFVQLQNHPGYEANITVYTQDPTATIYAVSKSLGWLSTVLAKSRSKNVILNMHGLHATDALSDGGSYRDDYQALKEIVGRHDNVVAIFAGHIHRWAGKTDFSTGGDRIRDYRWDPGPDCVPDAFAVEDVMGEVRVVPVFFSGGAEYNKYLGVEFEREQLTVQVIDSTTGTVVPEGAAETVSRWWPKLPHGYVACARENESCRLEGTKVVYYGAGKRWSRKAAAASVPCNNTTFGDPVFGTRKSCYRPVRFDDLVEECRESPWPDACDVPAVRERSMLAGACACEGRTLRHKTTGLYRCEAHGADCGGVSFEKTLGHPPNLSSYTVVPDWVELPVPGDLPHPALDQLRFGDFDGDGKTDVFRIDECEWFVSESAGAAGYRSLGGCHPRLLSTYRCRPKDPSVAIDDLRFGDFDGDGKTDLFTSLDGRWVVWDEGTQDWRDLRSSGRQVDELAFGDFDGDGATDVFYATGEKWLVSDRGVKSWRDLARSARRIDSLGFGDFDGDGATDVFHATGKKWLASDRGVKSWRVFAEQPYLLEELRFGDFNGDGRTDLFRINHNGRWLVYEGN